MKIRPGDTVVIISGKDKGKTGQVLRVLQGKNRVVVADINMRTRHMRKTPQRAGEIVRYEASLHASNVMLVDPKTKKRTRVGFAVKDGRKSRVARKSGEVIGSAPKVKPTKVKADEPKKTAKAETAEAAATKEKKEEKSVRKGAPERQPFWKRMGFGSDVPESGEAEESSHMHKDQSVPAEQQRVSNRSHQRGS